jgi:hypothetical protein
VKPQIQSGTQRITGEPFQLLGCSEMLIHGSAKWQHEIWIVIQKVMEI